MKLYTESLSENGRRTVLSRLNQVVKQLDTRRNANTYPWMGKILRILCSSLNEPSPSHKNRCGEFSPNEKPWFVLEADWFASSSSCPKEVNKLTEHSPS